MNSTKENEANQFNITFCAMVISRGTGKLDVSFVMISTNSNAPNRYKTYSVYLYAKIESILSEKKPFKRNFHANKNFFEST